MVITKTYHSGEFRSSPCWFWGNLFDHSFSEDHQSSHSWWPNNAISQNQHCGKITLIQWKSAGSPILCGSPYKMRHCTAAELPPSPLQPTVLIMWTTVRAGFKTLQDTGASKVPLKVHCSADGFSQWEPNSNSSFLLHFVSDFPSLVNVFYCSLPTLVVVTEWVSDWLAL